MESIFAKVPENLFSLLASPNKHIYFQALMVLRDCYQRELNFSRSQLVVYLISGMEQELYQLSFEEDSPMETEDAGGSDMATLSGRAHALVRRLVDTGWLKMTLESSGFTEVLMVPDYASTLLDTFYAIVNPEEKPYSKFTYTVYSSLKTADAERDEFMLQGLHGAYDATVSLRESLRSLLHNIFTFYQKLQDRKEIRELLAEHFDEYQSGVALKTYHPLKTVDSVYRFRPRILSILRAWLQEPTVVLQLARLLRGSHPDWDDGQCRAEVLRMMHFIIDTFGTLDDLLEEIDRRNTSYSRASVERLQYLLNTDRDVKGKLIELMKALPPLHSSQPTTLSLAMADLPTVEVRYLDIDSLYREPRKRRRGPPQRLRSGHATVAFANEAGELLERMNSLYSYTQIAEFLRRQVGPDGRVFTGNMDITEMDDFLRTIVALIESDEPDLPFTVEWPKQAEGSSDPQGTVLVNGYRLPILTFVQKD